MSAMKNVNTHRQKLHSPYQGAVAKLHVYMFLSGMEKVHFLSRSNEIELPYTFKSSQVVRVVKNLLVNAENLRDVGSISGSGRSPGGGHDNPFQCSCLENPLDKEALWATVHGSQRVGHD